MYIHHKIADIIFRTSWNEYLPKIKGHYFNLFRVEKKIPDVNHRIFNISKDSFTIKPLSEKEREKFSLFMGGSKILDSSLLLIPSIRKRLNECLKQANQVKVISTSNILIIQNFLTRELDIFHTSEFGGYDEELDTFYPQHYITANFKQIFSTFLANFSSVLLHSSGIILGDKAAIFLAPGEGGKTTILNLSGDVPKLSGDQVILRKQGELVNAHGTPLGGITSGPEKAKIGGFFILQKASKFELILVQPTNLIKYIWENHQNYTYFLPKQFRLKAFNVLYDICLQAPAYLLKFSKDYVDWGAIDKAMKK